MPVKYKSAKRKMKKPAKKKVNMYGAKPKPSMAHGKHKKKKMTRARAKILRKMRAPKTVLKLMVMMMTGHMMQLADKRAWKCLIWSQAQMLLSLMRARSRWTEPWLYPLIRTPSRLIFGLSMLIADDGVFHSLYILKNEPTRHEFFHDLNTRNHQTVSLVHSRTFSRSNGSTDSPCTIRGHPLTRRRHHEKPWIETIKLFFGMFDNVGFQFPNISLKNFG